jgi:arylsulfatase A-like enzyme
MRGVAEPLAVCAGLLLGACQEASPPAHLVQRPNILLITVDTLRPDHLGCYGYHRATSPHVDLLAREGTLFERAYTFWPKTRASFIILHTGKTAAQSGYSGALPRLLAFNSTIASLLKEAGYRTAAIVDNANVAGALGYSKGFDSYEEVWEEPGVKTEVDGAKAITRDAIRFLRKTERDPFFLWLHYVNPHAPYTPPPPNDTLFLDDEARSGPRLRVVSGFHGGIPRPLYVSGQRNLAYYVAQYDGEVRTADDEIGEVLDALSSSPSKDQTDVAFASDHGESLGEHDYYFDHGEDLYEPCLRVPLILKVHGGRPGSRVPRLVSTLDILPTLLSLGGARVPPGLDGENLLPLTKLQNGPGAGRLFAENDRGLAATWDDRFTLIQRPASVAGPASQAFYDRNQDPQETADVSKGHPRELEIAQRQLEFFLGKENQERATLRQLVEGARGGGAITHEACERLKSLGYVQECQP